MTSIAAHARTEAAWGRIARVDPTAPIARIFHILFGAAAILVLHASIGFGTAAALGLSAWWGVPFAVTSIYTIGWAWQVATRTRRVLNIEAAADGAEAKAREVPRA